MSKPLKIAKLSGKLARHGLVGRILSRMMRACNLILFSCDLGHAEHIDSTVEFWHSAIGCVIHDEAVIGKGCVIYQNVTIGANWANWNTCRGGVPVLGDHVMIGAGAVVLGPIHIGDGASVGANAVCLIDVPAGCTAAGIPARIIKWPSSPVGGEA